MDTSRQSPSDATLATSWTHQNESKPLGYANNAKGTQGIINALGDPTSHLHASSSRSAAAAGQYASIVRELPPRRLVETLVKDFFQNVAWHYDIVDETIFRNQLVQWNSLSYRQLQQAPDGLCPSLRSFPALLFQILAQALLFQPGAHAKALDDLKVTSDMKLSDLAAEYSHAGHRLASTSPKNELTLTLVQAGLMRACFEKTTGAVVEAWHTLGGTIRDAQELGLHQIGPNQEATGRNEDSSRELARQVWLMLHLWDAHMAAVLGRPLSTRVNPDDVPLPWPQNYDCDIPRPRDVILCGYHTAYKYLQDIHDLEKIDECKLLVDNIHGHLLANISNLPSWARPQRSRGHEPAWLTAALEILYTNVYFVLFALHRPFIFVESSSRARAFHAATQILESQARLFDKTESSQHKAFGLIFSTFDAMVLLMALHIRFADEFLDQMPATKTNLEWSLQRLQLLRASNELATSAVNTVQRLYRRMLTVDTSTRFLGPHGEASGSDLLAGLGTDAVDIDWEAVLQPDFEDILPPQPFNQLLFDGSLDVEPVQ